MIELMDADEVSDTREFTIASKVDAFIAVLTYGNNKFLFGSVTIKKGELKKSLCSLLWIPTHQDIEAIGARLMEVLNSDADWLLRKYG